MTQRDINWPAIREEYEGGASLRALAVKYGVSKTYIIERRNKENWNRPPTDRPLPTQGIPNRDVNAAVRVAEAIKLRQAGWTYERIAAQCGYGDPSTARQAIQRELNRVIVQEVEEWRNDHVSRLERLHEEVWPIVIDRAAKGRLFAVDRILMIAEREAKLLGLDTKTEENNGPQVIIEEVPTGYLEGPPA